MSVPVLANITEFGATPMFTTEELGEVGIEMVLYPLSAFRAMNKAALTVYQDLREKRYTRRYFRTNANKNGTLRYVKLP